jgi:hypothetical protein
MSALALDFACALDPVALATRAGLTPDPWQAEVLRATERQIILNCCRQSGKSTTTAALVTHGALYVPGSLSLLISPSERQSAELLRKVKDTLAALGTTAAEYEKDNTLGLETTAGSRVVALPGKEETIRTYSNVLLAVIDEASRIGDSVYYAIRPMVKNGRLVLLSTPHGKRGVFHREWSAGGADWRRWTITAYDSPQWTAEAIERERRTMPRDVFAEEMLGEFIEGSGSVFDADDLAAMFGDASATADTSEGYLTL